MADCTDTKRQPLIQDKVLAVLTGDGKPRRVKAKATQVDVYSQGGDSFTIQVNGRVVHIGNTSSNNLDNAISKALEKTTSKLVAERKPFTVTRYDL